ncbi:WD40 repeat-like protein [Stipitochalara longipes BDJ]|nr:WD40 repeat-like protein [Stipitochalara longipes BDJ]
MPPQAGQPRAPPPVIDLTLSDDEDVSYVQPQPRTKSAGTTSLLVEIPPMQNGLPVFTTSADRKSEKRDGASGTNYNEQSLPRGLKPLAAAPSSTKSHSSAKLALSSRSRRSAIRTSASVENLSSRTKLQANSSQNSSNAANSAKRRKTTHEGLPLGGRGSTTTSNFVGGRAQGSTSSKSANEIVDLTLAPPAEQSKTVITGTSRLQSSFGLYPSPEDELVQDSIESEDSHSMAILQKVFEVIKLALQSYHGELSLSDQKEITAKTAAWLIRPDLRTNYDSSNGKFDRRYEREMAQEAKAYVDSYVQTLRELNTRPMRLGGSEESNSGSSSSAEDIFDEGRQQSSRFARPRTSESPTTELSNDQPDGARDSEPGGKTVRRSERAKRSQSTYVFGNKRRRRNEQPGTIGRLAAEKSMDLDYEIRNPVQRFDSRDELAGIKAVARTMQAFSKKPETIPTEIDLLSLLRQREMHGTAPARVARCRPSLKASIYAKLEDSFIRQSEWTDASGDIQSISWISEDTFLCGCTAHLDSHNMEYNKPGNLLLGSTTHDTLRSFADHRIPRPKSEKLNAASMQQTQDPWLYSSVVSTAHCKKNGFSFTASFDETVKIWSILPDGSSMKPAGTWSHGGKVNFVVTSDHHERVATATGVTSNAVRVYDFDENSISESPYDLYGGNKALSQNEDGQEIKPWSYQPATIQWGKAPQVANLLLVGYSPRSDTGDDADIPDNKKDTGELCVWNTANGEPIVITSSHTQNVFEVQWHPTQPIFVAATSPSGIFDSDKTKTQIRLFALNSQEVFMNTQALDCSALDINELTIVANSELQCYVTASCTDGSTYVYDTAQGDQAVHILEHGEPLDPLDPDLPREVGDTGVQFAAWGHTTNRFYTGSSDGKVKAWNIKNPPGKAFVRNVLDLAGAIISGAFSKDFSKLLIGDATGKVHLLSINDRDLEGGPIATIKSNSFGESTFGSNANASTAEKSSTTEIKLQQLLQQKNGILPRSIKRPKIIIPHKEPPHPEGHELNHVEEESAIGIAQHLLDEGWLKQEPGLGVFQGVHYGESDWFDLKAHEEGDRDKPLLPEFHNEQQFVRREQNATFFELLPQVKSSDPRKHHENMNLDLDLSRLSLETQYALKEEGLEFEGDFNHTFTYELLPRVSIMSSRKSKSALSRRDSEAQHG